MHTKNNEKEFIQALEGVQRRTLAVGEQSMLCNFLLESGAVIPPHHHPNEQIGYLLSGEMSMTIADQERLLRAGDSWAIPGGVVHSVNVLQPSEVVEVFVPIRGDYR